MTNSNLSQCTRSPIQKLPPELLAEILSYLTVAEIKPLSLTCTILNDDCFPFVVRNLSLHGDHRPAPKFLANFKDRTLAVRCLRRLTLDCLNEDISKEILPWSTLVRSTKFKGGPLGNLTILPSLKLLQILELAYIGVQSWRDCFEILSTIPPSVKDLSLRDNTFLDKSLLPHPVTHKIEVEHPHLDLLTDLSSLLEDDCPISLRLLCVAYIEHPKPQELRDLLERSPLLVDLTICMRDTHLGQGQTRPLQFPVRCLKHLKICASRGRPNRLTEILLEEPSDAPHALETLSLAIPLCWLTNLMQDWDNVASALAQHRFPRLSALDIKVVRGLMNPTVPVHTFQTWLSHFTDRNAGRLHINLTGLDWRGFLYKGRRS